MSIVNSINLLLYLCIGLLLLNIADMEKMKNVHRFLVILEVPVLWPLFVITTLTWGTVLLIKEKLNKNELQKNSSGNNSNPNHLL